MQENSKILYIEVLHIIVYQFLNDLHTFDCNILHTLHTLPELLDMTYSICAVSCARRQREEKLLSVCVISCTCDIFGPSIFLRLRQAEDRRYRLSLKVLIESFRTLALRDILVLKVSHEN